VRKYAVLKEALSIGAGEIVKRIIVYEAGQEGVYVFLSYSADDVGCYADCCFEDLESAEEYCANYGIRQEDWIEIDNPLPDCQHDFIRPVRVKGRNTGNPQFGRLEVFDGNEWVDLSAARGGTGK
jgi:biofilm protein TabA